MQRPDKQGKDYRNSNPWRTVKRSRKKSRDNSRTTSRTNSRNGSQEPERNLSTYQPPRQFDTGYNMFSRFQKEPEEKYKPPPEPVYVPPAGPNYSSITKEDEQEQKQEKDVVVAPEKREFRTIVPNIPRSNRNRTTVRNQVPRPNNNVSFDVWEHTYFKNVLELSDIFSEGANKLDIDTDSSNFLDIFSHFVRDCSSGEISPFIEELDPKTDEFYMEYTIKRNDF